MRRSSARDKKTEKPRGTCLKRTERKVKVTTSVSRLISCVKYLYIVSSRHFPVLYFIHFIDIVLYFLRFIKVSVIISILSIFEAKQIFFEKFSKR